MKKISQIFAEINNSTKPTSIKTNFNESIREEYIDGKIFKVGQLVDTNIGAAEIISRGTNYVTLVKEGQTFKRWLTDIVLSESQSSKRTQLYKESFIIKGYKTKHFTRDISEMFSAAHKSIDDEYGLLTCTVCCDNLLGQSKESLIENFDKYSVEFEKATRYLTKFGIVIEKMTEIEDHLLGHAISECVKFSAVSKQKIANVISVAVDLNSSHCDPSSVVNEAVDLMKTKSYTEAGWQVIGSMLNRATESGIKWDKNKFNNHTQQFMGLIK